MRIAIITDAWQPQVSGVVTTLNRTIRQLEQWGHQILVISPTEFKSIPCPTYDEIPLALFPGRKLAASLSQFAPQAVHIATEGPLGWAARRWCLRSGLAFTTSYHTRFPEYIRLRVPIPLALSYAVIRHFHRRATRTMVVSEALQQELEGRGFQNLTLWSRGVDVEIFKPYERGFLNDSRPISIYVGRVAKEKNIEDFLSMETSGTKYVVGDGPARQELMAKYPRVRFPGYKHGEQLARYMAAADVFVFPSRTDTFGVVLLEANACGLPVAAYPVTGPSQIVCNGVNGVLRHNLALAVQQALHLDRDKCLAAARQYSWQNCSQQFVSNLAVNPLPQPALASAA